MTKVLSKLDELRAVLREIEKRGNTRASIGREARVDSNKITKFLGPKNSAEGTSGLAGVDGETALRLWEYAQTWLSNQRKRTSDDDSAEVIHPKTANRTAVERHGLSSTWLVEVKHENRIKIPGDLGLVVRWLGSMREATVACIGVVTGMGNRMILPCSGSFGRKIETFNRTSLQSALTAEEILKSDTPRVRLSRYLDAAWSITITYTQSNEYEIEVTTPRAAIRAGGEVEVWAREMEGLVLSDPRKARSAELMELAQVFPDLLDRCTSS